MFGSTESLYSWAALVLVGDTPPRGLSFSIETTIEFYIQERSNIEIIVATILYL
jgi:hypothetical protein